mgnify:CR=1 FL=1|jgi:hypothetical protein|tara:strand:+ start:436 stop:654 length:219 start_codon:yes stop_codon:yes gene_type:complete
MNVKIKHFIDAIRTASSTTEVVKLWEEVAREDELSLKDICEIHQACGNILVEAVHNGEEEKEQEVEEEKIFS